MTTALIIIGAVLVIAGIAMMAISVADSESREMDEASEILETKMALDANAHAAIMADDDDAYQRVQSARDLLSQCTEQVHPDKNDDTSRWTDRERYQNNV